MENDRVLGDLWGKSSVPVVLNKPYSEAEQVRGHGWGCFGWENQNSRRLWERDPSWWVPKAQRPCRDHVWLIPKAGGEGSQSPFGPGAEVPVVQAGNGGHWRMMLCIQGLTRDGSPARDQDAEASLGSVIPFGGTRPSCIINVVWIHLMVIQ